MLKRFLLAAILSAPAFGAPFFYVGPPNAFVDTSTLTTVQFTVPDFGTITDLNVSFFIGTPFADDVDVYLFHNGVQVQLYGASGDTESSVLDVTLDDSALTELPLNGSAIGTFVPLQPLSIFNGMELNGVWELRMQDLIEPGDETPLNSWSISGTTAEASATPEPGSLALLGTGLAGLIALRKRRS
jgi:subtilisin-like proprotein convertase family protein